jgi:pimeloyl-ACP methyl ester carboxylesterase
VPGLACTEDLFADQIASLRGKVAVSVADRARHDTMSAIARAVLATAPNRFALCGLSMGGYIAFEMVRQAPDRIEGDQFPLLLGFRTLEDVCGSRSHGNQGF